MSVGFSGVMPDRISKGAIPSTLHLEGLTPFSINQQSVIIFKGFHSEDLTFVGINHGGHPGSLYGFTSSYIPP